MPDLYHCAVLGGLVAVIALQVCAALRQRIFEEHVFMATVDEVKASLAKLQDDVTASKAVEDSAVALLNGLTQLLKDATSSASSFDELKASVDAIAGQVEADTAALGTAVAANTPAAPTA